MFKTSLICLLLSSVSAFSLEKIPFGTFAQEKIPFGAPRNHYVLPEQRSSVQPGPYSIGILATDTVTYPEGDISVKVLAEDKTTGTVLYMKDPRVTVVADKDFNAHPWHAFGMIIDRLSGHTCTSYAVHERVVITAAHCLSYLAYKTPHHHFPTEKKESSIENVFFAANVNDMVAGPTYWTDYIEVQEIKRGHWQNTGKSSDDWAVVLLKRPLPSYIKPLKLVHVDSQTATKMFSNKKINSAGYPEGNNEFRLHSAGCNIEKGNSGHTFTHNCPRRKMFSGAAIFVQTGENEFSVIGTHVSSVHFPTKAGGVNVSGIAVTTSAFYSSYLELLKKINY